MQRFNIRVYGLLIDSLNQKILVSKETISGEKVIKFPGGGLEFGEGIADCLKREWMEELSLEIGIEEHFFVNEFYQKSAWDDSQVISIYYMVSIKDWSVFPLNNGVEYFYFIPISKLAEQVSLPIDIEVAKKLQLKFNNQ